MEALGLLGLFCGMAVLIAWLLGAHFFSQQKTSGHAHLLLGGLFLAISLRLAKSIWFFILYDVAPIGLAMGFSGLSSIGPLSYLYTKQSLGKGLGLAWIHFLPVLFGGIACLFLNLSDITWLYRLTTFLMLFYLLGSWYHHLSSSYENLPLNNWNSYLLISLSIIWIAFVLQHLLSGMIIYAGATALASLPLLVLLGLTQRYRNIFQVKTVKEPLSNEVLAHVKKALEEDKSYLSKNLTLSQFSRISGLPSYQVSRAVKALYGKSFPEVVNAFRIQEVTRKLKEAGDTFIKIEGLAYDAGFNTPSSFYAAFKKETGMSPKAFQRAQGTISESK